MNTDHRTVSSLPSLPGQRPPTLAAGERRLRWIVLALATAALVSGCGSSDGDDAGPVPPPPPPPPPSGNQAPVASFTAAAAAAAGEPVRFDASASSDPEGQALTYTWEFGDGQRGGGRTIARAFAAGGSYTVRLTVDDGNGARATQERQVSVSAPPAAAALVPTLVIVRATDGTPLPGVTVAPTVPLAGHTSGQTNAEGRATVTTGTGNTVMLKFSAPGFADQFRNASLPTGADSGYLEVTMLAREAALTLADAAAGGALTGKDGASVSFEPGSLVDAAGNPVSGPVRVAMTPVDVGADTAAFPGRFAGVRPDGAQGLLLSYGTVEYALSLPAGGAVQLAPGRTAQIEIPVFTSLHRDGRDVKVGDTSPLWSLDERTGGWVEEGSGVVVASAASPSGLALRARVGHFSWWNHDDFDGQPAKPKPRCKVDTNADGILEDLTDTGHCWHAGTGPDRIDPIFGGGSGVAGTSFDRRQRLQAQRLADATTTRRLPAFAAYASTPVNGGVALEIPARADVTFRSYAKNGTLFGMKVINLAANESPDVDIVLAPVQGNPGTLAVTLPFGDNFLMSSRGEVDRFTFTAAAGASYEVTVGAAPGAQTTGTVAVLNPSGTSVASGAFDGSSRILLLNSAAAGTHTVVVTGGSQLPGSYRISIRQTSTQNSSCINPPPIAFDQPAGILQINPNSVRCWSVPLAAGEVIEVDANQNISMAGAVTLRGPNGELVATDPYGAQLDGIFLRVGVAQAGTYRLELSNTNNAQGTYDQFVVRKLNATPLDVPSTTALSDFKGTTQTRLYVLRPPTPGAAIAVVSQAPATGGLSMVLHPDGGSSVSNTSRGRNQVLLLKPEPLALPVLEMGSSVPASSTTPMALVTLVPQPIALDTDVATNAPAPGQQAVFAFEGTAGQQISWGDLRVRSSPIGPIANVDLVLPSGALQTSGSTIFTLPANGLYGFRIDSAADVTTAHDIRLRVNRVLAPQSLPDTQRHDVDDTLELGQVKRYQMNVTLAQLVRAELSRPSGGVSAVMSTDNRRFQLQAMAGDGPSVVAYAGSTGDTVLTVRTATPRDTDTSLTTLLQRSRGPFRLTVELPLPPATAFGDTLDLALPARGWRTFGFGPASSSEHLLCTWTDAPDEGFSGRSTIENLVFGPTLPNTGYPAGASDFVERGRSGPLSYFSGALRAPQSTLSVRSKHTGAARVVARMVPMPARGAITVSAAVPVTGSVAFCGNAYLRFAATASSTYRVEVKAPFAGRVAVYRQLETTEWTQSANLNRLAEVALDASGTTTFTFQVPNTGYFGSRDDYILRIEPELGTSGAYEAKIAVQ